MKRAKFNLSSIADEMYAALKAQYIMEDKHANCEECDGEDMPELCRTCFPFADDARLRMRTVISKVEGIEA